MEDYKSELLHIIPHIVQVRMQAQKAHDMGGC